MTARGECARLTVVAAVIVSACNGQFDFDTSVDAEGPPVIVVDGGSNGDWPDMSNEAPRPGVHIACGDSACLTAGCCSSVAGTLGCADISEGGTCSGLLIQCDDSDDCPAGQVCCAEGEELARRACIGADACSDEGPERVHCEPEARCRTASNVILCNPDRPSPCAQCIDSSLLGLPPGYHQCAAAP